MDEYVQSFAAGDEEWAKLHTLIGRIVISTNSAHWCVFEAMSILLNTSREETTPIYYSLKADAAQRDLTIAIASDTLTDPSETDLLKRLNGTITELGVAAGVRNAFIHSHWKQVYSGGEFSWACDGKPHPKLNLSDPLGQAEKFLADMDVLIGKLLELCDQLEQAPSVRKRVARTGPRHR